MSAPVIDIRITAERLKRFVTLGEMIDLQEGNLRAMRDIVSRFMWDQEVGDYYPVNVGEDKEGFTVIRSDPRAVRVLSSLTFDKLADVSSKFREAVNGIAADPQNAAP